MITGRQNCFEFGRTSIPVHICCAGHLSECQLTFWIFRFLRNDVLFQTNASICRDKHGLTLRFLTLMFLSLVTVSLMRHRNSLTPKHPKLRYGERTVVSGGLNSARLVFGFETLAALLGSSQYTSNRRIASFSPR
ncbi:hypothetical protein IW261DRAFT_1146419 [Armillaria novae-zelandiae]|uniref:Uncharacterized protein n=1 Tax=Armillaria novae-zelandiae TaxID=153914 RepID=A0AA39TCZ2_9AGAR|nr:hypothetical protein IW261DRAFT_1146419 [Armillaria novae-zelandiae]